MDESINDDGRSTLFRLWPVLKSKYSNEQYSTYLKFLGSELSNFCRNAGYLEDLVPVKLAMVVETSLLKRQTPRSALLSILEDELPGPADKEFNDKLVELVARVWLTIRIQTRYLNQGPIRSDMQLSPWNEQDSVESFVRNSCPTPYLGMEQKLKLDTSFTAAELVRRCGITLLWTNYLNEHLRFDARRRVLAVYQHKVVLVGHLQSDSMSVFGRPLLEEAIDTLNLLFPIGDNPTKRLLHREGQAFYGMAMCGRERALDLHAYPHWGNRLVELLELFNAPPNDLMRFIGDRRNLERWVTLWIGLTVLVLTLVSIAFGSVQTVYSVKQYNLALAQACLDPEASTRLPHICP